MLYRLWLHGLYGLYGPWCPLSPKRPFDLITHSLHDMLCKESTIRLWIPFIKGQLCIVLPWQRLSNLFHNYRKSQYTSYIRLTTVALETKFWVLFVSSESEKNLHTVTVSNIISFWIVIYCRVSTVYKIWIYMHIDIYDIHINMCVYIYIYKQAACGEGPN